MAFKTYEYETVDGNHFPDANKGDEIYYEFPISNGLDISLMEFSFIFPEGVTSSDSYADPDGTKIHVKLLTPIVGNFRITCIATMAIGAKREVDHIVKVIKVY